MTELLASASRSFVRLLASHEERSGQDGHSIMEIVAGEKETYNNWEGDGKNLPRLDVRIFRPPFLANFVLRYVRSRLFGKFVPIFVQLLCFNMQEQMGV